PEQYAGQMMKCPLCAGTFTVPALPTPPAPPPTPPPAPAATSPAPMDKLPDLGAAPSPPSSGAPGGPAAPAAGYTHTQSYVINAQALAWLAPVCLVAVFILSFLSWHGLYPGGIAGVTQNAWGIGWDFQSVEPVFKKFAKNRGEDKDFGFLTKDGP